jgi:hypothetical protein
LFSAHSYALPVPLQWASVFTISQTTSKGQVMTNNTYDLQQDMQTINLLMKSNNLGEAARMMAALIRSRPTAYLRCDLYQLAIRMKLHHQKEFKL